MPTSTPRKKSISTNSASRAATHGFGLQHRDHVGAAVEHADVILRRCGFGIAELVDVARRPAADEIDGVVEARETMRRRGRMPTSAIICWPNARSTSRRSPTALLPTTPNPSRAQFVGACAECRRLADDDAVAADPVESLRQIVHALDETAENRVAFFFAHEHAHLVTGSREAPVHVAEAVVVADS